MMLSRSKTSFIRSLFLVLKTRWLWFLGICVLVLVWPVEVVHDVRIRIPHTSPTTVAHALADFNNHIELFYDIGSWVIEDESNNYTSWRYEVRYACGARCSGRALVVLHGEVPEGSREGLHHGSGHSASLIKLYVAHEQCHSIPLLPWPSLCEDWVVWVELSASGGSGTDYKERAARRCMRVDMVTGHCRSALKMQQARRVKALPILLDIPTQYWMMK